MSERESTERSTREERSWLAREESGGTLFWLRKLIRQGRLAWHLFLDPRVHWLTKLIPPAVLVYIISPVDFLPDLALGLGQLDDLALLFIGVKLFIELCPGEVVRDHLRELGAEIEERSPEEVIEGEFRITEPGEGQE